MTTNAWQVGSLLFFGYVLVVGACLRGLSPAARRRAAGGAAAGAALIGISIAFPADGVANAWILPPAALLIGYWTSGRLFAAPMPAAERLLARIDEILKIDAIACSLPRPLAELLECAYAVVYPMIPIALCFSMRAGIGAERFWTVILLTDFVCFGMLPWIQTRPPRAVGFATPWRSSCRTVNLRVLAASSVQVNTFPSGHAAEALAAALLVSGAPPLVAASMFVTAAAISAGAVFGRYHYAADAIAGWAVALVVWSLL
jgi:hypothetical protein